MQNSVTSKRQSLLVEAHTPCSITKMLSILRDNLMQIRHRYKTRLWYMPLHRQSRNLRLIYHHMPGVAAQVVACPRVQSTYSKKSPFSTRNNYWVTLLSIATKKMATLTKVTATLMAPSNLTTMKYSQLKKWHLIALGASPTSMRSLASCISTQVRHALLAIQEVVWSTLSRTSLQQMLWMTVPVLPKS